MKYDPTDVRTWAVEDVPAKKLALKSSRSLTNSELLSVILSAGGYASMKEESKNLLAIADNSIEKLSNMSHSEMTKARGIGPKRASIILSCFELCRRRVYSAENKVQVKSSETVRDIFQPNLMDLEYEEFWILTLNRANRVIDKHKISQGGLNGTVVDTRIILKKALEDSACSLILCHNHPSGNKKPSEADISITKKIKEAGDTMDVKLLDHIIIAAENYFSFADTGLVV